MRAVAFIESGEPEVLQHMTETLSWAEAAEVHRRLEGRLKQGKLALLHHE